MITKKPLLLPAAVLVTLLGVLGTTAGCSTATIADNVEGAAPSTTPSVVEHAQPSPDRKGSDPTVCTTSWDKSAGSIEASMYNGTNQTLTLVPALSGHNGINEHWDQQPPTTLAPGQCSTMTAYTSDVGERLGVHAVYQMPNGDFVPFSADTHNGSENTTVFTSEPTYDWDTPAWTGTQDPLYNIWGETTGGTYHVHVALKLEGGSIDSSYQLTSSPITVAAGATSPSVNAACNVGEHVWLDANTSKPIVTVGDSTGAASALVPATLSPRISDGTVDSFTQYQGLDFSLHNPTGASLTASVTWTCDPSVWGTNGTAPAFLQDTPPSTATMNTPINYRFITTGFPAATYGLKSGQLPNGTHLDINGNLTGTPTQTGSYQYTVEATNAAGSITTDELTLQVQ